MATASTRDSFNLVGKITANLKRSELLLTHYKGAHTNDTQNHRHEATSKT